MSFKDARAEIVHRRTYSRPLNEEIGLFETLEETTSLSLLELDTKTFQVRDVDNLDRFKSGFVVDNFSGHSVGDVQ